MNLRQLNHQQRKKEKVKNSKIIQEDAPMNYFKKIVDWVIQSYEPEKPKLKPKVMFKKNGRTYYLKKRKKKR